MARVKPIVNREDVAPEHHALFDKLAALRGRISGPSTIVLHSPGLARPWNEVSEYLHRETCLKKDLTSAAPQHRVAVGRGQSRSLRNAEIAVACVTYSVDGIHRKQSRAVYCKIEGISGAAQNTLRMVCPMGLNNG